MLLRFRRSHPDVQLELRDMSTPDQVDGLAAGEIDIGFVRLPVAADRLVVRPVLDERLVLAIGPRSPWQRADRAAVGGGRTVHHHRALALGELLRSCAERLRRDRVRAAHRPGGERAVHRAVAGRRRTRRVAGAALRRAHAAARVRFRELTLPEAAWDIGVAWHRDAGTVPLVQRFVEMVRAARRAARGERPALHRGRRCARLARRDEREYREYLNEEQRSQTPGSPPRVFQRGGVETGCSAGRMQLAFHHGLLVSCHGDRTLAAGKRRLSPRRDSE